MAEGFDIFGGFGVSSPRRRERAQSDEESDVLQPAASSKHKDPFGVRVDSHTAINVVKNVKTVAEIAKTIAALL